jgi:hypothetical protein
MPGWMPGPHSTGSALARVTRVSPAPDRSVAGETSSKAAGSGRPSSRIFSMVPDRMLAPADSPNMPIFAAGTPWASTAL